MTSCGEQPQADEPLALVLRSGNCRICLEPMSSRELKESCGCCFMTVHQFCLAELLKDADWSPIKYRSAMELFCCGCIVERFTEVGLLVSLLRETGAEFAIFEPVVDAFMSEKSGGVWKRCARNAVKVWACTLASVKKPPSPWAMEGPEACGRGGAVAATASAGGSEAAGSDSRDAFTGTKDGGECIGQRAGSRREREPRSATS